MFPGRGSTGSILGAAVSTLPAESLGPDILAAFLNALPSRAAIVDDQATVIAVNAAWREFAVTNGLAKSSLGQSYLEVCDQSPPEIQGAHATATALRQVLNKQLAEFTIEYPCHSPNRELWFSLRISPLEDTSGACALLVHTDITESRASQERLRRLSRLYTVLSQISEAIVSSERPEDLYAVTCRIIVEHGLLQAALVTESGRSGQIVVASSHGAAENFLAQLVVTSDGSPNSGGTIGMALRTGSHDVCNDIGNDARMAPWQEAAAAHGYGANASFPLKSNDGKTFGCLTVVASEVEYFQSDEISLMLAVTGDLAFAVESRRKEQSKGRAQRLLRESEERYRSTAAQLVKVLDSSLDVICSFDDQGRFVQVNQACESVWGYTAEELLGTAYLDKVLSEDQELTAQETVSIMSGKSVRSFENRYRKKDGGVCHIQWAAHWSQSEQIMFCVARDITGVKANALRIAEQASLLDKAQDAILVRDLDHRVSFWKQSAQRVYGWTAEEAEGRSVLDLVYRDTTEFLRAQVELLSKGEWVGELEHFTKAGRALTVEVHLTLVLDEAGNPKSVLSIGTDITDRKQLEQQFLRAQRLESLGTLAGGIAHDLNNVLAPILMAIDLLRFDEADPERLDTLELMESSAKRGAEMVAQVLSFARGAPGQRVSVDLGSLIKDVSKIVRDTFPKSFEIVAKIRDDIWPVQADPTQLHQALLNLCVNARDAMPAGGLISLSAENTVIDDQYASANLDASVGPHLRVEVEDQGSGMDKRLLENIFDPFFTTKEQGKGTGLGLSTTLAIIKGHGGFLEVHSEPGVGSKFSIYLPADRDGQPPQEPNRSHQLPRGSGQTVLVIDDETAIRQVSKQTLEAFGYRVLLACDGPEAVSLYVKNRREIAVVVTDMMMPVMDGPATIRVLKRLNPDLLVIGASGISTSAMANEAAAAGIGHFLAKPYTSQTLLQAIKEVLETGRTASISTFWVR